MGFAELPTTYTMRSWTAGWVIRLGFQALFFALLGRLTGEAGRLDYMLVGNCVAVVAMEAMFVSATAVTERFQGTLPLLVASPSNMGLVYLGRGLHWPTSGLASSFAVLSALSSCSPRLGSGGRSSSPCRSWPLSRSAPTATRA
jgi:ABC-2 type transport system permease protein